MKKFRFLYIAAAALLFAACANEEDGIGNNGPVAVPYRRTLLKTSHVPPLTIHGLRMMPLAYMPHLLAIQQETTKSM